MRNKWLIIIVILAALIRFIGLCDLPPALNRDEAAIGWNAYSLLAAARDEHGAYLPLAFKSIGDYKMPLYIYATVIPVKLFGLNDFSIRFWSALAGVIAVIAVYYLVKELFNQPRAALLASFLMALNPWAVFYSRIGFEANLALTFFLTGLCLLHRGFKKISWFIIGLIIFLLALLTYSSSLIFVPLFLLIFLFIFREKLKPTHFISLIIFAVLAVLIFYSLWTISAQKSNITVFSDPITLINYQQTRTAVYQTNPLLARTWWNKYFFFTRKIALNYLKTFSPRFLLLQGGNHPWHQIPGLGNFYFLEVFFALIGLYWLIKQSKTSWLKAILLSWLVLAPLPSAITVDAPHATRSLHLLPIVIILSAFGGVASLKFIKRQKYLLPALLLIFVFNFGYAGYRYLITYPQIASQSLPVGLKQSLRFINQEYPDKQVYLTGIHGSHYLYPLIYSRFDPVIFQSQAVWTKPDPAGLINAYQFGRFTVVDDLKDIQSPAVVILSLDQAYHQTPLFSAGNYQTFLK